MREQKKNPVSKATKAAVKEQEKLRIQNQEKDREQTQKMFQEEEYIILNHREEEEDTPQEMQRSLENYISLAKYQYFDCDAIRKDMNLTRAIAQKGEKLLQENKIRLRTLESGYVDNRNDTVGEAIGEGIEGKVSFPVHMIFTRDSMLF